MQTKLANSARRTRARSTARYRSPLAGKLFDPHGNSLVATHATKNKIRYRYYVSRNLHHCGNAAEHSGLRIPAKEIEGLVARELAAILASPLSFIGELGAEINASDAADFMAKAASLAGKLNSGQENDQCGLLEELIERIEVGRDAITVRINHQAITRNLDITAPARESNIKTIERQIDAKLKRSGIALKLVEQTGTVANPAINIPLIRAIIRGHDWWQQLKDNPTMPIQALATEENVTISYITRLIRLAFLSPTSIERISNGQTPAHLSLASLQKNGAIPSNWKDQADLFGINR